jgi:pimeloyl-ACP methyl ester carboxylesterase
MAGLNKNIVWMCGLGLLAVLLISLLAACGNSVDNGWTKMQASGCSSLQGLTIPASAIGLATSGAVIQSVTQVAASATGNTNGEYCKVTGFVKPVNATSPSLEFEVNLPTTWNRRALQMGGGGYDGSLVTGLTGFVLQPENVENPLKQGFVTLGGDGGHKGGPGFDGSFGLDDEALLNFGKQSIKKVHDVAIEIMKKAYGRSPDRFYFIGGSQGGHEALDAAARYPQDYDGVVSHFPAYNVTMLHLGSLNVGKALYANGGVGWINAAKTKLITDAVYQACDKLDGAEDGIIGNVKACNAAFDINKLRCPKGADTGNACLSDAQLTAARQIASDYKVGFPISGMDTFPKYPLFDGALFQVSTFGTVPQPSNPLSGKEALLYSVGDQTAKFIITRNAKLDTMRFDPKQWKERISAVASIMDVTDVSLDKFRAKGGKIILTHGTVDDFITPYNSVAYYERQVQQ